MNLVGGEQVGERVGDLERPRLLARLKFGRFRNTRVKMTLGEAGPSHHTAAQQEGDA